jgi:hypothetical protein
MHDPDSAIQDADIEMGDAIRQAYHHARLKKKGICVHNWSGPSGNTAMPYKCHDCGKLFANFEALDDERRELLI